MIISGYQLMVKSFAVRRPLLNNIWNEVFVDNGPESKSLIEISGAPATGKSILLYELIARASLSTLYGGKCCKTIFVDLSHKFDVDFFVQVVQTIIKRSNIMCSQLASENPTKYCEPIIYLPCYSADQFELAFEELENLLWDNKTVSLVAIDSLETFYWDECNNQLQRMSTHYKKLLKRLKLLCQEHNICCAYTVDTNYLGIKSKSWPQTSQTLIDYKLKLVQLNNGSRYLNDSLIKIDNGIEFLNGN